MSLISWIGNLFGHRWTNEEVVQYTAGDSIDHGFDDYSFEKHIALLRNRRPSLHHTQRLIVDTKIRELEASMAAQIAREKEAERRRTEVHQANIREVYRQDTRKTSESSKPVAGNVIAKPPKFSVDDDAPTSDFKSWGHTSPTYSSPASHSHSHSSHSCSGSSHSSSSSHDSGGSSDGGGSSGGCD